MTVVGQAVDGFAEAATVVGAMVGSIINVGTIVEYEGAIVGAVVGTYSCSPDEVTSNVNTGSGDDAKVVDDDSPSTVAVMVAP